MHLVRYITTEAMLTFKSRVTYRAASVLNVFTNVFLTLVGIYLWRAIFLSAENRVIEFSFSQMVVYIALVRFLRYFYPTSISSIYGSRIKNGDIVVYLLRPIRLEWQLLGIALGESIYNLVTHFAPSLLVVLIYAPSEVGMPIENLFLFLLTVCMGYSFILLTELIVGAASYYTESLWGINRFKNVAISFMSGELLPLPFYPSFLLHAISFLPFSAIYLLPIQFLLGMNTNRNVYQYAVMILFPLVLLIFYIIISKKIIKNITVYGG